MGPRSLSSYQCSTRPRSFEDLEELSGKVETAFDVRGGADQDDAVACCRIVQKGVSNGSSASTGVSSRRGT